LAQDAAQRRQLAPHLKKASKLPRELACIVLSYCSLSYEAPTAVILLLF
jgi:hypothetical protein